MSRRKIAIRALLGVTGLFVAVQLVPYGRAHSNPPATRGARWSSAAGRRLAEQSCYDCHSNLTAWRWYSALAPASWLVQHDVEEGRGALNFSEWDRRQPDLGDVVEQVSGGEMPPLKYRLLHPSTTLSAQERDRLAAALTRLYATDPPGSGRVAR